jgi:hypothetical protein
VTWTRQPRWLVSRSRNSAPTSVTRIFTRSVPRTMCRTVEVCGRRPPLAAHDQEDVESRPASPELVCRKWRRERLIGGTGRGDSGVSAQPAHAPAPPPWEVLQFRDRLETYDGRAAQPTAAHAGRDNEQTTTREVVFQESNGEPRFAAGLVVPLAVPHTVPA